MAITLQTVVSSYVVAKQQFRAKEDGLKLNVFYLGTLNDQQLTHTGFFFAKQTIDNVFNKNKPIEKVKNVQVIYTVLLSTPDLVKKLFPGIVLPNFTTKEGLKNLQEQLEKTPDYQSFINTQWRDYTQLKTEKKSAKETFSNFVKEQKKAGTFSEEELARHTTDKRIIKLAKKLKTN